MSAPHVGLGAFQLGVEKLFDKIPEKAFAAETYGLGSDDKKSRRQSESQSSGDKGDPVENSDRDTSSKKQPDRQPRSRKSQDDYSGGYEIQPARRYSRDDSKNYNPNRGARRSGAGPDAALNTDGPSDRPRGTNDAFWAAQERVESPMQQDPYYPPPPGQNYHRYNPADYQPQGYNPNSNDRYASNRNQSDPYARPNSAGGNGRYSDDRHGSRDVDRRDRRRKSRRSPSRSRSRSSDMGIKGKFDKSREGLTTGAIGALAGGLIGNEVGKSPLATLAGLVIGGLGANAWEAKENKKKNERERSRSRPRNTKSSNSRRARSEGRRNSTYQDDRGGRGGSGDSDTRDRGGAPNAAYNDRYAVAARDRRYDDRDGDRYGSESEESDRPAPRRKKDKEKKRDMGDIKETRETDPGPWGDVLKW